MNNAEGLIYSTGILSSTYYVPGLLDIAVSKTETNPQVLTEHTFLTKQMSCFIYVNGLHSDRPKSIFRDLRYVA